MSGLRGSLLVALAALMASRLSSAHDTNIIFADCKLTSFHTESGKWTTVPGEFQVFECDSGPGELSCNLRTAGGESLPQTFTMHMDTAFARLAYQGDSWGDVLYIDPTTHRAVLSSRLLALGVLGAKMCSGIVLDEEQYTRAISSGSAKSKGKKRR